MKIPYTPQFLECSNCWDSKVNGVILVEKEEDIEPLWKLLCEQDDYWEQYKSVIKVAPKQISSKGDLSYMIEYVGKTDIYDIPSLKSKIPFLIYQEQETEY